VQHYVLNKVKKPGLREDAPQQKLSLFQIRAADATYIAQKQLAEATKQVTITNSRTKNLQDTATPAECRRLNPCPGWWTNKQNATVKLRLERQNL
jgi:hypothetical protein